MLQQTRTINAMEHRLFGNRGMTVREALTFDDVLMVPRFSEVRSRHDVDMSVSLAGSLNLSIPILSANMDSVTEAPMAIAMARAGGLGVIHRFMRAEEEAAAVAAVKAAQAPAGSTVDRSGRLAVAASIGVRRPQDELERARRLVDAGADLLVVDVAHGHARVVLTMVQDLKRVLPHIAVMAGNVVTAAGVKDLREAGADLVKVGVGPGSACTTRIMAGVGVPQWTAIADCAGQGVPIIGDGGIRAPSDLAKAIGAGADAVMIGNLLARTVESAAQTVVVDGASYKRYRGMASVGAALARQHLDDANRGPIISEGIEGLVPLSGAAADVLRHLTDGLRSAMSYVGAAHMTAFHQQVEFVRMTAAGLMESHPHDVSH